MANLLGNYLPKNAKPKPPLTVLYGQPGIGKTSAAASFKDSAMVYPPKECGIEDLKSYGQVPADYPAYRIETWEQCREVTKLLREAGHRRVFFDTGDRMLELLATYVLNTESYKFKGEQDKFDNWGKGYQACIPEWQAWIQDLLLLKDAGVAPFVLCHAMTSTVRDPTTEGFRQWRPNIYRSENFNSGGVDLLGPLTTAATEVGFMHFDVLVDPKDKNQRGVGTSRFIDFGWTPAWESKSRLGVGRISMGNSPQDTYNNFTNAFATAIKAKSTQSTEVAS